jgi:GNAT superfamily N-acetyltransferase
MVKLATIADIESWMTLAREVEALFGPMSNFDATVRAKISDDAALCVHDGAGGLLGGVLVGGEAPENWIRWLAVRRSARRKGVGSALLTAVLDRWPGPCTISLATFGADNPDGLAARRLYERFGFVADKELPRGPEGGTRQLYILVRP